MHVTPQCRHCNASDLFCSVHSCHLWSSWKATHQKQSALSRGVSCLVQVITVQPSRNLNIVCQLKHWSYVKGVNTKKWCDWRSQSVTSLLFIRTIKLLCFGLSWCVGVVSLFPVILEFTNFIFSITSRPNMVTFTSICPKRNFLPTSHAHHPVQSLDCVTKTVPVLAWRKVEVE